MVTLDRVGAMTTCLAPETIPLFDRFPELRESLPWLPFSRGPSPVAPLSTLSRHLGGGDIWIKNDGLYGTVYGGNKPRKLEFVLANAVHKGVSTVLTTGALRTNHGLATALYGAQAGLDVVLLLTYEQPDDTTQDQLRRMQAAGARLHYTRSFARTAALTPYFALRYRSAKRPRWPYLLAPGASTPLGVVGYVNAALELAAQVRDGRLPEPETIILPLGSGGTAAGLLLGLRIAGLNSRVLAVAITRAPTAWPITVRRLAAATAGLLRRRGLLTPLPHVSPGDLRVVRGWIPPGFGKPSRLGEEARTLLAQTEGIEADSTYTGKTLAALIELRRDGLQGPVLYWHTYNAIPLATPVPNEPPLPAEFRRLFSEGAANTS